MAVQSFNNNYKQHTGSNKICNRLNNLFLKKTNDILNIYCTAGFPKLTSTAKVLIALQNNGADIIEVGIPYSDPIADGAVIQQSNMIALKNGMSIAALFKQLNKVKDTVQVPVILMGYLNPVLQYGMERFCKEAAAANITGIILPDLPMFEYEKEYQQVFIKYNLNFIFLVTPETDDERIRQIDNLCSGFIYAVSSSSTTGKNKAIEDQGSYFKKLQDMQLKNPVLVGFGIKDRESFAAACKYSNGAIIGSAYIKAIENSNNIEKDTKDFINRLKG
ncbi:MAG: tryptophan synthase subunit alpha [Ferruginibacter sp.]|nr:tryptophan synthase subunit alpha [Ferruginibacter sp.]